ncbi:MAG: helix-turn-helix domain-containing protein [Candidatus Marsarchaeota archaeon]|nr:helix-turn-helix domain-containing protein [Candidatus Marsarchaeota archaeon]
MMTNRREPLEANDSQSLEDVTKLECDKIAKVVLPAVRISIAEEMQSEYNLSQQEIADKLGIAQVAVSKYLNGKYSGTVKRMRDYIKDNKLANKIARKAAENGKASDVRNMINELCTSIAFDGKMSL